MTVAIQGEFFLHLITLISFVVPFYYLIMLYRKAKGWSGFVNAFIWLIVAIIPIFLSHVLELLDILSVSIPEGLIEIIEHVSVLIMIIALGMFIRWFDKSYVSPIYADKK